MTALPLIALVGNPNAGKSALFNALTGARQKTGNYPGVTVERHSGRFALEDGRPVELVDLPGTYSLTPTSPDEVVTRDVVLGRQTGERRPDALIIVVDAGNLDNHLCFALELIALGLPCIVALNMVDLAERDGLTLDAARLAADLGVPVIPTVAVRKRGLEDLRRAVTQAVQADRPEQCDAAPAADPARLRDDARRIAAQAILAERPARRMTRRIDGVVLHPIFGPIILFATLFAMFQLVYAAAEAPVDPG
jgi:ferrous iron transport protein B